jgi:hypothetical protein
VRPFLCMYENVCAALKCSLSLSWEEREMWEGQSCDLSPAVSSDHRRSCSEREKSGRRPVGEVVGCRGERACSPVPAKIRLPPEPTLGP